MNTIRVTLAYRGVEGFVPGGLYELEDERLLGIQNYLLKAGHAKLTDETLPVIEGKETRDSNMLQLQIHAGRVTIEDGQLVATKLEPDVDPATPSEDYTVETLVDLRETEAPVVTPPKKKRR